MKHLSFAICVMVLLFTGCESKKGFSVSASKKVIFSPGNLQYTCSTETWSFAPNQYDVIGADNLINYGIDHDCSEIYAFADKVDLFGWSTSATNFGVSTSWYYEDYYGSFVDWGTNKIGNDTPNTWRTLSMLEWKYLLYDRTDASDLCGVAQVNGVNGLILLPDDWKCPAGVTFKSGFATNDWDGAYGEYQTFSAEQWYKLEQSGAIFLPTAGWREGSSVGDLQEYGYYWSATTEHRNSKEAWYIFFTPRGTDIDIDYRRAGISVRLVKDL